jgi:hypothetical protein
MTACSGAVVDILEAHHYTKDWPHTVSAAIKAGCDVESAPWKRNMPWGRFQGDFSSEICPYYIGAVEAVLRFNSPKLITVMGSLGRCV